MPLTLDHEILTIDGWKKYNDVKKITPGPDGKPTGENDTLVCLDITNNQILNEKFIGSIYIAPKKSVIYSIKNEFIDTLINEDDYIPYTFNENNSIVIDRLVNILYNMKSNNINIVYLITNTTNINIIEVKIEEMIRQILETDLFTFYTNTNTYYVRRNNLEYWTSN